MQNPALHAGIVLSFVCAVIVLSSVAWADTFAKRVAEAQNAYSTEEGKAYDQSLGPAADLAMRVCLPPGSTTMIDANKFAMVAYVAPDGALSQVEVQPRTEIAQCFAARFARMRLAPPPTSGGSAAGFPITVEMSVLP